MRVIHRESNGLMTTRMLLSKPSAGPLAEDPDVTEALLLEFFGTQAERECWEHVETWHLGGFAFLAFVRVRVS